MDLLLKSIAMDWPVLLPIFLCSILVVTVAVNRFSCYSRNKRDVNSFIKRLEQELKRNNLDGARNLSEQLGGLIGMVATEGIKILEENKGNFSRLYDITISLATRQLEKFLTLLGTIGGVAPFLGLFGTVVRILFTFQDLGLKGNQSAAVAEGIASALIATAFGLGVAIVAVILYNTFHSVVRRYEDDFQLLNLLFISYIDKNNLNDSSQSPQSQSFGGFNIPPVRPEMRRP